MKRLALIAALGLACAATQAAAQECDRACVLRVTDSYLAALAAHDPAAAPLADEVRFVENVTPMQPGEGLWASASGGPTAFQIHVPDAAQGTAGWMGIMERDGKPVLVAVRLKLQGDRVTEAEHLLTEIPQENLERLQKPRSDFLTQVPEGGRAERGELIRIAESYYDAIVENDGSLTPFADDCQRHENGGISAAPDLAPRDPPYPDVNRQCRGQLDSQVMKYIQGIDNRRVFAADPVTGLVMGLSHFRHPMDNHPYEVVLRDGSRGVRDEGSLDYAPFDMPAAHIFKVGADGKVHEIEAVGFVAPFNSPTGWEEQ